jgi:hypothetical protein
MSSENGIPLPVGGCLAPLAFYYALRSLIDELAVASLQFRFSHDNNQL